MPKTKDEAVMAGRKKELKVRRLKAEAKVFLRLNGFASAIGCLQEAKRINNEE